ncbi:hypothetical protein QYE76_044829 [Lolium multiflorum]|uniref:Transposase n=1 Tax=Lolium multiflorum TaxID=4521 RepID=A0AAD8TLT8_LOLMU|nr:hypothetical protein QYE76_044829 [Lolium multiflorum]
MFPFERFMGVLKKYVRNRARPEGSIAKGYGNEEVIEFCVDFVPDLKPIGLPQSRHEGRLSGKGTIGRKSMICMDDHSLTEAHHTVLTNSSLVAPYFEKHKNILRSDNPGKPESWIRKAHMETFGSWLRKHLMSDNKVVDQLYMLAKTPSSTITTFQGYEINGNTFYTIAQDKKSTNQNSGVRFDAATENGQKVTYYGYIEEIWELDYGPSFKVPLFRCKWFKLTGGGVKVDQQYGMTMVDFNNLGYLDEPFVLAKDVAQVFYVKDMSSKPRKRKDKKTISTSCDDQKRHIVLSGKRNIVGVEDKTDMSEDYNMFAEIPPFKVNTDPSIKLNDEDAPWIRHNRVKRLGDVKRQFILWQKKFIKFPGEAPTSPPRTVVVVAVAVTVAVAVAVTVAVAVVVVVLHLIHLIHVGRRRPPVLVRRVIRHRQALAFKRNQELAEKKALEDEAESKLERGKEVAQLGEQSKQSIAPPSAADPDAPDIIAVRQHGL